MGEPSPMWVPGEAESRPDGPHVMATALRMMDESILVWRADPARGTKLAADASVIFGGGVLLALQDMQIEGTLPPPGTPAWDEFADRAEAGDVALVVTVLVRDRAPVTAPVPGRAETEAEFRARLDRIVAAGEARRAAGGSRPALAPPPRPQSRPEPERDPAGPDLSKPGGLMESLRQMGLM